MRISPVPSLRWVGTAYVHTVRNTPLTIMMTFAILGVWTQFQLSFSHDFDTNFFVYAVIALSIYHSAFICEAIRSGVNMVLAIFIMFAMGFVIIVVPIGALTTWSSRKLAVKR